MNSREQKLSDEHLQKELTTFSSLTRPTILRPLIPEELVRFSAEEQSVLLTLSLEGQIAFLHLLERRSPTDQEKLIRLLVDCASML